MCVRFKVNNAVLGFQRFVCGIVLAFVPMAVVMFMVMLVRVLVLRAATSAGAFGSMFSVILMFVGKHAIPR